MVKRRLHPDFSLLQATISKSPRDTRTRPRCLGTLATEGSGLPSASFPTRGGWLSALPIEFVLC